MAALKVLMAVGLCLIYATSAQIPIPHHNPGFVYNKAPDSSSVHLDAFIDILCPDSKASFPILIQLADYYASIKGSFQLAVHMFPLPYHRNSFLGTKGVHAFNDLLGGNSTYQWIDMVYQHKDQLVNTVTQNTSKNDILSMYVSYAIKLGVTAEQFKSRVDLYPVIEENTRVAWKYACSRGVVGTPTFFVNDVLVNADSSWTVEQWKQLINSVLKPDSK